MRIRGRLEVLGGELLEGCVLEIVMYHITGPACQESDGMNGDAMPAQVSGPAHPEGVSSK